MPRCRLGSVARVPGRSKPGLSDRRLKPHSFVEGVPLNARSCRAVLDAVKRDGGELAECGVAPHGHSLRVAVASTAPINDRLELHSCVRYDGDSNRLAVAHIEGLLVDL